jgi:hypothetical protein
MNAFTLMIEAPTGATHAKPKGDGAKAPVPDDNRPPNEAPAYMNDTNTEMSIKQTEHSHVAPQDSSKHVVTTSRTTSSSRRYGVWDLLNCP